MSFFIELPSFLWGNFIPLYIRTFEAGKTHCVFGDFCFFVVVHKSICMFLANIHKVNFQLRCKFPDYCMRRLAAEPFVPTSSARGIVLFCPKQQKSTKKMLFRGSGIPPPSKDSHPTHQECKNFISHHTNKLRENFNTAC